MNRFEKLLGNRNQADIEYLDGDYNLLVPGDYVICGFSRAEIPLENLKYWNVERQEPYATAEIALKAEKKYRDISE